MLSLLWSPSFGVVAVILCGSIPSALLVEGRCLMGYGSGLGLRRKPLPACRLMMAMPLGAVSLLGGIMCLPLPPPRPMAGRLAGGSSSVPASLHSTHCRLDCLGRGGCFAAMSPCFISGGCFAAVFVLLGGCFATGSCFELGRCFVVVLLWRMLCRRGRTFR